MSKVKDLFDMTEDDFIKKEEPKGNTNMIKAPPLEAVDEVIKEVSTQTQLIEPQKKVKKYFKYRDGRVKYLSFFSRKDKINIKEMKDGVKDNIRVSKNRADKGIVLRNISIFIIVASLIFMYFYYIRDSGQIDTSVPSSEVVQGNEQGTSTKVPTKTPSKEKDRNPNTNLLTGGAIMGQVRMNNGKELDKVEKYLDLKSNRVSTISDVRKYKKEKEDLYVSLLETKSTLKEGEFEKIEELIVKSISMSEEFLSAFDTNRGNDGLKEVINKYTNN